ncbi:MAG: small multi-drug export protein [Methanoculleaceae archaeon]
MYNEDADAVVSGNGRGICTRLLRLLLPPAIPSIYLGLWYFFLPSPKFYTLLGLIAAYTIPPAGKESIIPLAIVMGLPWWMIASTLFLTDCATALFIAWNFEYALRIPLIGPIIQRGMENARRYAEDHPFIRSLSTLGLFLFIFFPFQGTGAMNASILGNLLGIPPVRVTGCVMAGSLASCVTIGLGTEAVLDLWSCDRPSAIFLLLVLVAVGTGLFLLWRHYTRRFRRRRP